MTPPKIIKPTDAEINWYGRHRLTPIKFQGLEQGIIDLNPLFTAAIQQSPNAQDFDIRTIWTRGNYARGESDPKTSGPKKTTARIIVSAFRWGDRRVREDLYGDIQKEGARGIHSGYIAFKKNKKKKEDKRNGDYPFDFGYYESLSGISL